MYARDPLKNELHDESEHVQGSSNENVILVTDEIPPLSKKLSRTELLTQMNKMMDELSLHSWFTDEDSLVFCNLLEKANTDLYKSKHQEKITNYFSVQS